MVAPLPNGGPGLFPYAMVAAFMVAGSVYIVSRLFPRRGGPADLATAILMVGLLVMTSGLWFAEIFAILDPGDASVVSVFIALNSMMGVVGAWAIGLFYRAEEKHLPASGWGWPLVLAGLLVGNELLMGVAFVLAEVGPAGYGGAASAGLASLIADGIDSVWFFGAMFVTMEFLVLWLPIPTRARRVLVGFSATAIAGPWVVVAPLAGAIATAAIMAIVTAYLLWEVARDSPVPAPFVGVSVGVTAAFAATGLAVLAFVRDPGGPWSPVPFAVTSLLIMLVEVVLLTRWAIARPSDRSARAAPVRSSPEPASPTVPSR